MSTSTNSATNSRDAFDELIPVLVQCFGVILLGYIAGRLKVFSESQAKGLNFYVTKFALPTVFFRAMVTINLSGVCWFFVMAISVSKLIGFLMAIMFTFLISRRFHLGIAAIVAMFVSQSNDVALAYPILYALFPDLASYVYLVAPGPTWYS
uniref:SJCHGC09442 protein n=1 Tax=Schistosoma japonicum TaxID=6182 RepID=Q5DDB7_SCHJA|nr:SJCHGC09442 protein [Schistosoma japonicum]